MSLAARAASLALALLTLLPGSGASAQEQVTEANGALLRALDKITGETEDLQVPAGKARQYEGIIVSVEDCRFPTGNPAGNAFAHVTIWTVDAQDKPIFSGWMVAGSPALNALDHRRYDVWVLRCITL